MNESTGVATMATGKASPSVRRCQIAKISTLALLTITASLLILLPRAPFNSWTANNSPDRGLRRLNFQVGEDGLIPIENVDQLMNKFCQRSWPGVDGFDGTPETVATCSDQKKVIIDHCDGLSTDVRYADAPKLSKEGLSIYLTGKSQIGYESEIILTCKEGEDSCEFNSGLVCGEVPCRICSGPGANNGPIGVAMPVRNAAVNQATVWVQTLVPSFVLWFVYLELHSLSWLPCMNCSPTSSRIGPTQ